MQVMLHLFSVAIVALMYMHPQCQLMCNYNCKCSSLLVQIVTPTKVNSMTLGHYIEYTRQYKYDNTLARFSASGIAITTNTGQAPVERGA